MIINVMNLNSDNTVQLPPNATKKMVTPLLFRCYAYSGQQVVLLYRLAESHLRLGLFGLKWSFAAR